MKALLFFVVFFLIGIAIVLSVRYWNPPLTLFNPAMPKIKTNFSLNNAPSESLQGTIASISGKVSWLSRTASKPLQLKSPHSIQQGEEISTGSNGHAIMNIQNDSQIQLLPDTHVSIIQLLPVNFVFMQDKGTVSYINSWQVPLSVKSLDLLTIQTKGNMVISVDQIQQTVSVSVSKGSVREGYEDLQNNSTVTSVNAGQTFLFDEQTKTATIQ